MNDIRFNPGRRPRMSEEEKREKARARAREYRRRVRTGEWVPRGTGVSSRPTTAARPMTLEQRIQGLPENVRRQIANHFDTGDVGYNVVAMFEREPRPPLKMQIEKQKQIERMIRQRRPETLRNQLGAFMLSTVARKLALRIVKAYATSRPSAKEVLEFIKGNIERLEIFGPYQSAPDLVPMLEILLRAARPWAETAGEMNHPRYAVNILEEVAPLVVSHAIVKYRDDPHGMKKVASLVEEMARIWHPMAERIYWEAPGYVFAALFHFLGPVASRTREDRWVKWNFKQKPFFPDVKKHEWRQQTYGEKRLKIMISAVREISKGFARRLGGRGDMRDLRRHPEGVHFAGEVFERILQTNQPELVKWFVGCSGIDVNAPFASPSGLSVHNWFEHAYRKKLYKSMLALAETGYALRVKPFQVRSRTSNSNFNMIARQLFNANYSSNDDIEIPEDDAYLIRYMPRIDERTALKNILFTKHPGTERRF